jgi:hypothetical protein
MKIVNAELNQLQTGTVLEFNAQDLIGLRFVGEKEGAERKDGKDALTYYRFALGNRVFTIGSDDMESVELLRDAKRRATVGKLLLEATSFERPILDEQLQDTGEKETAYSFRFHGVVDLNTAKQLATAAGELQAIDAKFAPKPVTDNTMSPAALQKMIADSVAAFMPAPAPKAEAVAG